MLDETEFKITVRAERLTLFETQSKTEQLKAGQLQSKLKLQQSRDLLRSNLMIYKLCESAEKTETH